jgi:hypothetical protein
MSRYNDIGPRTPALTEPSQLPAINWSLVGQGAPTLVDIAYGGPGGKLPKADAVVMTWTSAEWAALDHVFVRSATAESPAAAAPKSGACDQGGGVTYRYPASDAKSTRRGRRVGRRRGSRRR